MNGGLKTGFTQNPDGTAGVRVPYFIGRRATSSGTSNDAGGVGFNSPNTVINQEILCWSLSGPGMVDAASFSSASTVGLNVRVVIDGRQVLTLLGVTLGSQTQSIIGNAMSSSFAPEPIYFNSEFKIFASPDTAGVTYSVQLRYELHTYK